MAGNAAITKSCRDCGEVKPLEAFPLQKLGRLGRHPLCKPCRAAQERRRYARQRVEILERSRLDPERRRRVRWRALQRKYQLHQTEFEALFAAQRGCCAICERRARLLVDHDHTSGAVRGLLCASCNFALGELGDDPARCEAAASYLEREPR